MGDGGPDKKRGKIGALKRGMISGLKRGKYRLLEFLQSFQCRSLGSRPKLVVETRIDLTLGGFLRSLFYRFSGLLYHGANVGILPYRRKFVNFLKTMEIIQP